PVRYDRSVRDALTICTPGPFAAEHCEEPAVLGLRRRRLETPDLGDEAQRLENGQLAVQKGVLRHEAEAFGGGDTLPERVMAADVERKSTRLNSSHVKI